MKKLLKNTLIASSCAIVLSACGGGTPSKVIDDVVVEKPDVNVGTAALVVAQDFNFRVDSDATINVSNAPTMKGIVNVYTSYLHHDETLGKYYPNKSTLLTSFYPESASGATIQLAKDQEYLIVEFVPMTSEGTEIYKKVDLTGESEINVSL